MTGIIFYKQLTKKKLYMKLIMMMSLCDMFGSIGSVFGYPDDNSACLAQGALIFFFYRAAWFWATSISFSLYCQVTKGRLLLTFKTLSWIIWGLSVILELLPVANGLSYGNCYRFAPDISHASTFGTLSEDGNVDPKSMKNFQHWIAFTFVFPLASTLFTMFCCHSFINWRIKPTLKLSTTETSKKILNCLKNAEFYPMVFLICWVPHICVFILVNNVPNLKAHAYALIEISFAWGSTMGIWLFILYFVKSKNSRRLWSLYLFQEKSFHFKEENLSNLHNSELHSSNMSIVRNSVVDDIPIHIEDSRDSSASATDIHAYPVAINGGGCNHTSTSTLGMNNNSGKSHGIEGAHGSSENMSSSRGTGSYGASLRLYYDFEDDDAYYSAPSENWQASEDESTVSTASTTSPGPAPIRNPISISGSISSSEGSINKQSQNRNSVIEMSGI